MKTNNVMAGLLSVALLVVFLGFWHVQTTTVRHDADATSMSPAQMETLTAQGMSEADIDAYSAQGLVFDQIDQIAGLGLTYDEIEAAGGIQSFGFTTGGAAEEAETGFPSPSQVWREASEQIFDPFYDRGPNDKGIGIQLQYSLARVLTGFVLAIAVAVPLGFLIGMSPLWNAAINPYVQVLKPISPLAWLPVALFLIKDSEKASIFVIFICSIWPMLINTAFGVANVKPDWLNIARTLELSKLKTAFRVILPAAAPTILTGMRISIGIAWLVIVAAEMVIGGVGIGYFVWNEWNGLNLASMIFAIVVIGVVGLVLDMALGQALRVIEYKE
ncbi:nitrate ABC transporter permease [Oricola sp.]|uniref:nitrate ABC transporter permease n=1 Tax=Oricola sp. TaxID=1979950 RepID=UPI003BAD0BA4